MHLRRIRRDPDTLSLQEPIETGRDGAALQMQDAIPDDTCMEKGCEQQEEIQWLHQNVECLNGRERQIILLRYGLAGQPPLTQQQAADILQISRSYVSRLESKALDQLRKKIQKGAD